MSKALIQHQNAGVIQEGVTATNVAGQSIYITALEGTQANPALQKLVAACFNEIETGNFKDSFIEQLAHFNKVPTERNLQTKLEDAGCNDKHYQFAIEAKESFAKFFEIMARHPSGQAILVSAFRHAYSIFMEQINPHIEEMNFNHQRDIFETTVVQYLDQNLTGLPGFTGRMEALGLLYFLADNCFIEYAKC